MDDGSSWNLQITGQNLCRCTLRHATQQGLKARLSGGQFSIASNCPDATQIRLQLQEPKRTEEEYCCLPICPHPRLGSSSDRIPGSTSAVSLSSTCFSRESSQLKILNRSTILKQKLPSALFWPHLKCFPICEGRNFQLGKQKQQQQQLQ